LDYLAWNDLIAQHFFRPDMAGRSVYLLVTEELITQLGEPEGVALEDFLQAVKRGPIWSTKHRLCQKALECLKDWRNRGLQWPPYLGYLALFVLAAGVEGPYAPHAYYPRLRSLIGEESGGTLPSYEHMSRLWEDLESWSNHDKGGILGIFTVLIAGGWVHVGIPKAQTLLTEAERKALPSIFADADLDPSSPSSEAVLVSYVCRFAGSRLRQRTLSLLYGPKPDEAELHTVLVQRIGEELQQWDGTVGESPVKGGAAKEHVLGFLRLCCEIDRVAKRATATLRCVTNREFPEDGFHLCGSDSSTERYFCSEALVGWSSPLVNASTGTPVDGATFDWLHGAELEVQDRKWKFRLPPSSVRVFVSGGNRGLPGLIEVRRIEGNSPLYVAAPEENCAALALWGSSSCAGFEDFGLLKGLPAGWKLFHAEGVLSDKEIRTTFPILALPSTTQLELQGGIRSSQGNSFFRFAPPDIILEGGTGTEELSCNGRSLSRGDESGAFQLPPESLDEVRLQVEVHRDGQAIARRTLYMVDKFNWRLEEPQQLFGRFGDVKDEGATCESGVAGSYVKWIAPGPYEFELNLPSYEGRRVFFVGREVGQIVSWPAEILPEDWSPVWAIPLKKKGRAIFCGTRLAESDPLMSTRYDRKKLREWKEIIWHRRMRITPPSRQSTKSLWIKYQEAARLVR
jgi:hypothetical protein